MGDYRMHIKLICYFGGTNNLQNQNKHSCHEKNKSCSNNGFRNAILQFAYR